ncbi:MAG: tetratricopeptide repeat protein [Oscillatoria sp. Prado101]|jgi:tetratricopeptide (TPR) repeat protein|nr:tetratricopeptide repeat protein [Oscillatoria sp. Prado101]
MNSTNRTIAILGIATALGVSAQLPAMCAGKPPALVVKEMSAEDLFNKGMNKIETADYKGAIEDFTQALALQPNMPDAYYFRGLARDLLEDNQGALQDYSEAIRLTPSGQDSTYAYNNRGTVYAEMQDYQKAIEDYDRAVQSDPTNANAYYNRALAHIALKDSNSALSDLKKAADLYKNQGKLQDYEDAMKGITELEQLPRN